MAIPDDPGAGQQWSDVDPDLAQRRQADHCDDQAQQRRSQHRLKGTQPRARAKWPSRRTAH